ncbi:hypothetical protein GOP56_11155 [Brevibacillus sp. 7WMA2]|uniref:hypothetical protein n=1 Tax=Brevibacillus TaxID=55080 RepID=UPI000EB02D4D|nr:MULTISPECIES: hypothetical protein [Brevibacillus]AYK07761.1 hypothetical protein D8Z77_16065 [Brevibacillus laterosporus]QIC06120.1 hypothetical protein GOP56_11155 [Brevibacillus sp. 7WMA2]
MDTLVLTRMERMDRIATISAWIDDFISQTGDRPKPAELERLTDAILHEELTDNDEHKMTHHEYPILSATQYARRTLGKHKRRGSGMGGETSLKIVEDTGTDGISYRKPSRRRRSPYEMQFVDNNAKIRNKARQEQYAKDIKASEVKSYFIA